MGYLGTHLIHMEQGGSIDRDRQARKDLQVIGDLRGHYRFLSSVHCHFPL